LTTDSSWTGANGDTLTVNGATLTVGGGSSTSDGYWSDGTLSVTNSAQVQFIGNSQATTYSWYGGKWIGDGSDNSQPDAITVGSDANSATTECTLNLGKLASGTSQELDGALIIGQVGTKNSTGAAVCVSNSNYPVQVDPNNGFVKVTQSGSLLVHGNSSGTNKTGFTMPQNGTKTTQNFLSVAGTAEFVNDGTNFLISEDLPLICVGGTVKVDAGASVSASTYSELSYCMLSGNGGSINLKDGCKWTENNTGYIYQVNGGFLTASDTGTTNAVYLNGTDLKLDIGSIIIGDTKDSTSGYKNVIAVNGNVTIDGGTLSVCANVTAPGTNESVMAGGTCKVTAGTLQTYVYGTTGLGNMSAQTVINNYNGRNGGTGFSSFTEIGNTHYANGVKGTYGNTATTVALTQTDAPVRFRPPTSPSRPSAATAAQQPPPVDTPWASLEEWLVELFLVEALHGNA
jgi:hypothetical protein